MKSSTATTTSIVVTVVSMCMLSVSYAETVFTDDALAQFYGNDDDVPDSLDDSYASIKDLSTLKDRFRALENIDDMRMLETEPTINDEGDSSDVISAGVSKRPFCNGFTGCGRSGKRTSSNSALLKALRLSSLHDSTPSHSTRAKRPFCNGFYGCGNPGKRIVIRHTYHEPSGYYRVPNRRSACGPFGCTSEENTFIQPWFKRMRTLIQQKA